MLNQENISFRTVGNFISFLLTWPHRYLHTNVHRSIICNSQKVETALMPTNRWIDKPMWCVHTIKYLALKTNTVLIYATTWMYLENIMLSDLSQTQNDKYCMILHIWDTKNSKFIDKKSIVRLPGPEAGGNGELLCNGNRVSVSDDEKFLEEDSGEVNAKCKRT